jgi:hypothetical protein
VRALADRVGLADPSGELVVEFRLPADPELVHEEPLRVGSRADHARVTDDALEIQVPGESATGRPCARESASRALERDDRLGDRIGERAAGRDQLDELPVDGDRACGLVTQVIPKRPDASRRTALGVIQITRRLMRNPGYCGSFRQFMES